MLSRLALLERGLTPPLPWIGCVVAERRTALLLIAHGSRRLEANEELGIVAAELRDRGRYPIIQIAYLELATPTIETGARKCVELGATEVILLPYFLSMGKHVVDDLSTAQESLSRLFPGVRFVVAAPLGRHPFLLDVLEERARAAHRN